MSELDPRYEVLQPTATATIARDRDTGREVVIKELTLGRIQDWKELDLFEREVATLRQLDHPAIPRLVDEFRGEDQPTFYLVCERVEGRPLGELDGILDEPRLLAIARRVLEVLVYLQSFSPPILHRNITPDAILVTRDTAVHLIDFGSIQVELHGTVGGSTVVGTSGYMAPEQLLGRAVPASDLYALGATLVHLITGEEPADLPLDRMRLRWRHLARFGSERFHDWVDRLVAPDPRDRFVRADDALRAMGDQAIALYDGAAGILATRPAGTSVELTRGARRLELTVPSARVAIRPAKIGVMLFCSMVIIGALLDPHLAAVICAGLAVVWLAVEAGGAVAPQSSGHLLLDVDRGFRVHGPSRSRGAGPFSDVVGVERGYRGQRDGLWLATRTGMLQVGRGLTPAECDWINDEVAAFLRENRRV